MNKKVIIVISIILVVVVALVIYFLLNNNSQNNNEQNSNNPIISDDSDSKRVVVYFSATGNTKRVAGYIQGITGSDIIEIIPADEYTSADLNYSDDDCRANQEQNDDNARPEIANEIAIDSYDTIYLGFPIWWGDVPKIILTFLDTYDLSGKNL